MKDICNLFKEEVCAKKKKKQPPTFLEFFSFSKLDAILVNALEKCVLTRGERKTWLESIQQAFVKYWLLNPTGWGKDSKYEEILDPAFRALTHPNLGNKIYMKVKEGERRLRLAN